MSTSPTLAGRIDVEVHNLLDQDSTFGSGANLYISADPQGLELRLWNLLDGELVCGRLGPGRAHVALRIRAGVLGGRTRPQLDAGHPTSRDWYLTAAHEPDGSVTILLTNRGRGSLVPGQPLVLRVVGLVIEASGGARSTQLEVLVDGMHHDSEVISGTHLTPVSISSRVGAPMLPVHLGVVGSDTVINNGIPSDLTLRIENLQPPGAGRDRRGMLEWSRFADSPTTLHLSVDASDDPFALATLEQAAAIQPSVDGWAVTRLPGSVPPVWAIAAQPDTPGLEPFGHAGSTLDLHLRGVATTHQAGPARIVVRYFNVPGHWDGHLVCLVHKGTIVESGGRAGVGTATPAAELDVNGTLRASVVEVAPADGPGQQDIVHGGTWVGVGNGMGVLLATVESHRSIVVEVTFFAHDVNSNTNQRALRGVYMITRNWDRPPSLVKLHTDFDYTAGLAVDVDVVTDQNDVKVVAHQPGGLATNIYWRVSERILRVL